MKYPVSWVVLSPISRMDSTISNVVRFFHTEIALIALEGKNVIGALIDYLPDDFLLAPHGVSGHNTALDVETLEQFRDSCDLVGFIFRFHLSQDHPIANRPGTDHMNSRFAIDTIMRAPCGFPINGDNVRITKWKRATNPTDKALAELLGIDEREHSAKSIVRENPSRQLQEGLEPQFLLLAKGSNFNPVVCPRFKDEAGLEPLAKNCRYLYRGAAGDPYYFYKADPPAKNSLWDLFELNSGEEACKDFYFVTVRPPHGNPVHMHLRYGNAKSSFAKILGNSAGPEDTTQLNPWWSVYCAEGQSGCD